MKWINIALIGVALISCSIDSQREKTNPAEKEEKYRRMVGDILFDPALDYSPTGFAPCSEYYSYQYYNFEANGLKYRGEKPQLVKEIMDQFQVPETPLESGYITIRFVVNCKGKPGYFRIKAIDENYEPKEFSEKLSGQLLSIVSNLNGWQIKSSRDIAMDYHQYLTYRIVDNQIKSIVP